MHTSPIKETVRVEKPQYFRKGHNSWIEPGWYADGADRVKVPVYAENSARNLLAIGGQGSGKTGLLDSLGLSAMSSGHTVVWYCDGQGLGGKSSPFLSRHADWNLTGPDRTDVLLDSLEGVFAERKEIMEDLEVPGLTRRPSAPA